MDLAYVAVALIGIFAAIAELLSRYRDAPWDAVSSKAGIAYLAFNAAVCVLGYFFIREVFILNPVEVVEAGETSVVASTVTKAVVTDVILAGVSSMAILRSSFFTVRVGDKDVEIGLAGLVDVFRTTIDRDVDRVRAGPRAAEVAEIMAGVSFVRAQGPLTSMCLNLLQNVGVEERVNVEQQVDMLAAQTGRTDESKALELGLILAGTVGFSVLKSAAVQQKNNIAIGTSRSVLVSEAVSRLTPYAILTELPTTCIVLATTLTGEDQRVLSEQIDQLSETTLTEQVKAINAGLLLLHVVGEENFMAAVNLLADPVEIDPVVADAVQQEMASDANA